MATFAKIFCDMLFMKYSILTLLASLFLANDASFLQEQARQKQQNIAVYFSGSDWCASCHKFKEKVLSQPTIDALLTKRYVFYVADFPQRKKLADSTRLLNEFLAEKLNPAGIFPSLIVADEHLTIQYSQQGSKVSTEMLLTKLTQYAR